MNSIIAQPPIESTQGRQMAAALALAHLLEHNLPVAEWTISHIRLDGQVFLGGDDKAIRAAIDDYANYVRAEVVEVVHHDGTWLVVEGTYRSAPIRVWGDVAKSAKSATIESSVNS
jgi:hypothetical protein